MFLHQGAVHYLDRWLVLVGARRGPIFHRVDWWGHIGETPIIARAVGFVVNKRREQAGLPRLSTHDFRRTFIGEFIDAGGDLAQAQRLVGHASPETTSAYDRRPAREACAAVDRLSLPSPDWGPAQALSTNRPAGKLGAPQTATGDKAAIVEATGFDRADVRAALVALNGEYIHRGSEMAGFTVKAVTAKARRAVGQWPTGESLAQQIVARIAAAADHESDPEQQNRLRQVVGVPRSGGANDPG